ncbi:hypothetical protein [Psychromonas sp. MME2]|uniref:hypothetical protein n=1 Tax=unclassified Psychromonas TaxID=2614957 RepID=UPI00339BFED2
MNKLSLLQQSELIFKQDPLADDAWQQLEALEAQATGKEKEYISLSFEALIASATPEQFERWSPAPTIEEMEALGLNV